jgi:hypothetical protein
MGAVVDAMILSRLFWLFAGVLIGLLLIPVLILGVLLLGLCLLLPVLFPMLLIAAGATLIAIGSLALCSL